MAMYQKAPICTLVSTDVALNITNFINLADAFNLGQTCKQWRQWVHGNSNCRNMLINEAPFSQETISAHQRLMSWNAAAKRFVLRQASLELVKPSSVKHLQAVDAFLLSDEHLCIATWTSDGPVAQIYDLTSLDSAPTTVNLLERPAPLIHDRAFYQSTVIDLLSCSSGVLFYAIHDSSARYSCSRDVYVRVFATASPSPTSSTSLSSIRGGPIHLSTSVEATKIGTNLISPAAPLHYLPWSSRHIPKHSRRRTYGIYPMLFGRSSSNAYGYASATLRAQSLRIMAHDKTYYVYGELARNDGSGDEINTRTWLFWIGRIGEPLMKPAQIYLANFGGELCEGRDFAYRLHAGYLYLVSLIWKDVEESAALWQQSSDALNAETHIYDCVRVSLGSVTSNAQDAHFQRKELSCGELYRSAADDHRWRNLSLQTDEKSGRLSIVDLRAVWLYNESQPTRVVQVTPLPDDASFWDADNPLVSRRACHDPVEPECNEHRIHREVSCVGNLELRPDYNRLIAHSYSLSTNSCVDLYDARSSQADRRNSVDIYVGSKSVLHLPQDENTAHKNALGNTACVRTRRINLDNHSKVNSGRLSRASQHAPDNEQFSYANEGLNLRATGSSRGIMTSKTEGLGEHAGIVADMNNSAMAMHNLDTKDLWIISWAPRAQVL